MQYVEIIEFSGFTLGSFDVVKYLCMFMVTMFALAVYHKLYNRSLSSFISIAGITVFACTVMYVDAIYSFGTLAVTVLILHARAMLMECKGVWFFRKDK